MHTGQRGFTLVEVLIVVIILGILAGLAMPRFLRSAEMGRARAAMANLQVIRQAQSTYHLTFSRFADLGAATNQFLADDDTDNYSADLRITVDDTAFDYNFTDNGVDGNGRGIFDVEASTGNGTITINQDGVLTATGDYTGLV